MIVPHYWARAQIKTRHQGRSITVVRQGWSDRDPADAQKLADMRAAHALQQIIAGEHVPRQERRTAYGVEGVPIREQIVQQHGTDIITRNKYGALCLNTPDVVFADIDFDDAPSGWVLPWKVTLLIAAIGTVLAAILRTPHYLLLYAALLCVASNMIMLLYMGLCHRHAGGGALPRANARITAFIGQHPHWHLRVYRTPAGLRLLAMHDTASPQDAEVQAFFDSVQVDPLFARMCRLQHCFRARLTAKPWRAGIKDKIRPPNAFWSPEHAQLPERLAWIANYEQRAAGFAACHYLGSIGATMTAVHPRAATVRDLHDSLTGALSQRPLA